MLVLPWLSSWWFAVVVHPRRGALTQPFTDAGWHWTAGQLGMLSIRLPDLACATAVGVTIGSIFGARSHAAAAACATGLFTTCVASRLVFTGVPDDARVTVTLLAWDLLLGATVLVGERLGNHLRSTNGVARTTTG